MSILIRDTMFGFLSITVLVVIAFVMLFHFDIAGTVVMTNVDPELLNIMEVAVVFLTFLLLLALCWSVVGVGFIRVYIWDQKNLVAIRDENRNQQAIFVLKRLSILIGMWVLAALSIGRTAGFW